MAEQGGKYKFSGQDSSQLTFRIPTTDTGTHRDRARQILQDFEMELHTLIQRVYREACDHSPTWEEEAVATELDDLWRRLARVRASLC